MDSSAVSTTVLPLVGVALGTLGALTGQYLATRGAAKRHDDLRAAEARSERKETIVGFLDAAQRVEQFVDGRRRGRTPTETAVDDCVHALWLSKKRLELVCGPELTAAAHRYTSVLDSLVWSSTVEPGTGRSRYRAEFMDEARRQLGVAGPPLYSPTPTEV
jgi:hypothetical protein